MLGGSGARETTLDILEEVFGGVSELGFTVQLWDGTVWPKEPGGPAEFILVLNHPGALREMLLPPTELNLGEAYIYGDFGVKGDLVTAFPLVETFESLDLGLGEKLGLAWKLRSLPKEGSSHDGRPVADVSGERHSRERDSEAISYHYDVSNAFYALWLDRRMIYSCAYFKDSDDDIHTAQKQKLDHICRKLRLKAGERMLDIGCGWGGLVLHAAERYGVEALGITLSEAQVELAQRRIQEAGLEDRCRVVYQDYRDVAPDEPFDKLVSVGMFEHVGLEKMRVYFKHAWEILREGGLFLNHAIARPGWEPRVDDPDTFSNRYVFPDGELTPISHSLDVAETTGFEVRDVESLREHYALTLRRWVRRLEERREEALEEVDEVTYRIWRLFMSGSAHGFETGRLNVYQALLAKIGPDGESGLPLTRADLYRR